MRGPTCRGRLHARRAPRSFARSAAQVRGVEAARRRNRAAIGCTVLTRHTNAAYKRIETLYADDTIKSYKGKEIFEVQPHVYALADNAYRNLLKTSQGQCVIISGESGAGKVSVAAGSAARLCSFKNTRCAQTEASKFIMRYIASITGKAGEIQLLGGRSTDAPANNRQPTSARSKTNCSTRTRSSRRLATRKHCATKTRRALASTCCCNSTTEDW